MKIMAKWTKEQEAYLLVKREDKIAYSKIAELMSAKFGVKRTVGTIAQKYKYLTGKPRTRDTARKPIYWNQKKVDFVFSCLWNSMTIERIKQAFEEEFDYRLSDVQLKNCLAKRKPSGKIQALAERMLNPEPTTTFNPLKTRKDKVEEKIIQQTIEEDESENWREEDATRKQLRYLASLTLSPDATQKEVNTLAKGMKGNYTKGEACDKINEILALKAAETPVEVKPRKKNVKVLNTKEEVTELEKFVEKHGNPKTRHLSNNEKEMLLDLNEQIKALEEEIQPIEFTREQDLYLLINWHTMSIDEARAYFEMPYYLLAKRLELLIDSTEPSHIELLMEAANAINERKRKEDAIRNMGYWKRRKLRKQQKKVAKLEKKLKRMRGE